MARAFRLFVGARIGKTVWFSALDVLWCSQVGWIDHAHYMQSGLACNCSSCGQLDNAVSLRCAVQWNEQIIKHGIAWKKLEAQLCSLMKEPEMPYRALL
ncbi:hypothetical protein BX589_102179 [Paraburkholderia fungorum]|nr:hypothetical protein BX589_102179 [Paraburkholderia fungorum]